MWLVLSLFSAVFLGMYDVAKKSAVSYNAVFPVLFFSTMSAVICAIPLIILSFVNPGFAQKFPFFVSNVPFSVHLLIMAKSVIVGLSWVLSYFGLKNLPVTIASPLRATAPIFTVLGAVTLFGERPEINQWIGIVLILAAYILYSRVSRKDTNANAPVKWIVFMIMAALTGALSAGFDKYLLQVKSLPPLFVLFWFLFYLMFIYGIIVLVFWFPNRIATTRFSFRYSIVLVGLLLVVADIVYMTALSDTNAKLALVSSIRRSNILISFIGGIILFKERNIRKKIVPFLGIIAGLLMIML